jgi:small acid-soluble spore protein F (minor alpha/beta-type SASP)
MIQHKEVLHVARRRRRGVMSEQFKYELAEDLGFLETVQREGWGGIRAKDAGNMVKRAIQIAEQAAKNNKI